MSHAIDYDEKQKIWKHIDYPFAAYCNRSIGQVFLENVKRTAPEKILEKYHDTGEEKTMFDIYKESVMVAINLRNLGMQVGDVLVLYSMVNPKVSALTMGSLLIGVIVSFFEPKLEKQDAESVLELISPTLILYEEQYSADIKNAVANLKLPKLKQVISIDGIEGQATLDSTLFKPFDLPEIERFEPPSLGNPTSLVAAYMLTSGSSGLPKVVQISHSAMLNGTLSWWDIVQQTMDKMSDWVVFSFSPLRWISQVNLMFQSLLLGMTRVCANGLPNGPYGRNIILRGSVTHFFSPPSIFKEILLSIDRSDSSALKSLRCIFLGGEAPSQSIMDLSKQMARNATVYRIYGMTELAGCIAIDTKANGGYLTPGVQLKILDDTQHKVGPNTKGQICVRPPQPYMGYLTQPNSSFNFNDADGFFNTGDYGFMDDSKALNVVARYKTLVRAQDIIMIPNEVESMVNTLPGISASIFAGFRKSASDTQDSGALFILLNEGIKDKAQKKVEIDNVLRANLTPAEYAIVKKIIFLDKFPLMTSGKVNRGALVAASMDNL